MTPISRVEGWSGLVVHALFGGDVGGLDILGADEFGVDKYLGRFAKTSGVAGAGWGVTLGLLLVKIFCVRRRRGGELINSDKDPAL